MARHLPKKATKYSPVNRIIMRLARLSTVLLMGAYFAVAAPQQPTVSVGAITKYTGVISGRDDVRDLKEINNFLNSLESQLAGEFVKYPDVEYLDRTNTEDIFEELHLSSKSAFDPSSGALRGLMGRLDFLAVIDSSEPMSARLRLIDVQSGAVKAIETCKRSTSFFGTPTDVPPACIAPFVSRTRTVVQAKRGDKQARLQRQALQEQAAREQTEAQRKQLALKNQSEQKQAETQQRQLALEKQAEQKELAQQQQAQALVQTQLEGQMAVVKPDLDDALSRLSTANSFWGNFAQQLASSGISLRSEIRTALNTANADGARCQQLLSQLEPSEVKVCTSQLNRHLDRLDSMK